MAGFVPDQGLTRMLVTMFNEWSTVRVHLYKNNYTPTYNSDVGDFVENDFPGYSYQDVGVLTIETNVLGFHFSQAVLDMATFTRTVSGTDQLSYGYFVTNGDGDMLWAEYFGTPIHFQTAGDFLNVTGRLQLRSGF